MKYLVTFVGGSTELFSDEDIPSLWADMEILSIVREDQVLVSPREVIERCKEIFPRAADSAFDRILAELEGEGMKA